MPENQNLEILYWFQILFLFFGGRFWNLEIIACKIQKKIGMNLVISEITVKICNPTYWAP